MSHCIIQGGYKLNGKLHTNSSKNKTLPIIAAIPLSDQVHTIKDIPEILDAKNMLKQLQYFGGVINGQQIQINTIQNNNTPDLISSQTRSSILFIYSLMHVVKELKLTIPGGCALNRPIDMHIDNLKKFGIDVVVQESTIHARIKDKIHGTTITMPKKSVGATQGAIICASKAIGVTHIHNVAIEPEVIYLIDVLNSMGAQISMNDEKTIKIVGVPSLNAINTTIPKDRIEAATFVIIAAMCKGRVEIYDAPISEMKSIFAYFDKCNINYQINNNVIIVNQQDRIQACDLTTDVYPGIPTDIQPQISAMLTMANGNSIVKDNVFPARISHIKGLNNMGANIKYDQQKKQIQITGITSLQPGKSKVYDLRCASALLCAAMATKGSSEIADMQSNIDRGHDSIIKKITQIQEIIL